MKQIFSIVSALVLSGTMFAQTIAIDGANTDWSTVPMLTEPGVGPVVKMVVPQDGLTLPEDAAFCVMTEGDHELMLAGYPVLFVDADKSTDTGETPWYCPSFGKDYQLVIWDEGANYSQCAANTTGSLREICFMKNAFSTPAYTGSLHAFVGFDWGNYMIPATPTMNLDENGDWKWSESKYHAFNVAPYVYADLAGTHAAAQAYSIHEALLPGATLQMSTTSTPYDTEYWASWTVELKKAAKYTVSANVTATNTTSLDLSLVDVATNKVVATFAGEEMWAPAGETTYGEWDLSAVPAGKYMLKAMNHVQWSDMALTSITLTEKNAVESAVEDVVINIQTTKVIKNGQLMIVRDNVQYNVLGAEIK